MNSRRSSLQPSWSGLLARIFGRAADRARIDCNRCFSTTFFPGRTKTSGLAVAERLQADEQPSDSGSKPSPIPPAHGLLFLHHRRHPLLVAGEEQADGHDDERQTQSD